MSHRMNAWLSWKGMSWGKMGAKSRRIEVESMLAYYGANPPVYAICRGKLRGCL
jgi:hypothetical protein